MIVFQLACEHQHTFEGWFTSADDFDKQRERDLVECPACGSQAISKLPAGLHMSTSKARRLPRESTAANACDDEPQQAALFAQQQNVMAAFREFLKVNTENVGAEFAECARRMHYGEEPHKSIRGQVSRQEASELRDEGIDCLPVPPGVFVDDLQ